MKRWHAISSGLVRVIYCVTVAFAFVQAPLPSRSDTPKGQKQIDAWWDDLAKPDPEASRALLKFAAQPGQTVEFLKDKMKPLKISEERVKDLLGKLGSDDEKEWKAAFEELEYFDPRLAIYLEKLMADVTEYPARQRLVEILSGSPPGSMKDRSSIKLHKIGNASGFNFIDDEGSWWAEHRVDRLTTQYETTKKSWARAIRAITLLENIRTSEAIAILQTMGTGHPEAQPTIVAKEALKTIMDQTPK